MRALLSLEPDSAEIAELETAMREAERAHRESGGRAAYLNLKSAQEALAGAQRRADFQEHKAKVARERAELLSLDDRARAVAEEIRKAFPPLAHAIVALMATCAGIAREVRRAESRIGRELRGGLRFQELLSGAAFAESLQLPDVEAGTGFIWHPNFPLARLDDLAPKNLLKIPDLGAPIESLNDLEAAQRKVNEAKKATVKEYDVLTRAILHLISRDASVFAEIERRYVAALNMLGRGIDRPMERLSGGRFRALSGLVSLPSLSEPRRPIWAPNFDARGLAVSE